MFKLLTDNSCDVPVSFYDENDIGVINLKCLIDGEVIFGEGKDLPASEFYASMRNGAKPTTSQVNPEEFKSFFLKYADEYDEILYLGFSSGLSGTVGSAKIAAEEIAEERPDIKLVVIDTLCAAMGQGLLVYHANLLKQQGKSMDEVADWVNNNMQNMVHLFTVDDLYDLWRGGRLSKTSAFIGTLVSIKPIMNVNGEGKLIAFDKVRGRKKSLNTLVDEMEKRMGSRRDDNKTMIMINHGDCIEDAEYVRDQIKERFGFEKFMINNLSPVIGAHTGPSLVALFFVGDIR